MPSYAHQEFSLPTHDLPTKSKPIALEKIAYSNAYDFTKKHRHRYFELLFFEKGGGSQLIDFEEYIVQDHSCYIVLPNQIHLLKRNPKSHGFLLQFYSASLSSKEILRFLQTRGWNKLSGLVFENDKDQFYYYKQLCAYIANTDEHNNFSMEKDRHIIQACLFSLFSKESKTKVLDGSQSVVHAFLNSVEENFTTQQTVKFYMKAIGTHEKKLMEATKKHLGMTPLKVIHARILLEAKRLLVFDDRSQKEITYILGFDSPSSFSAFIKAKTGNTVSQLQTTLVGIHNK